MSRAPSIKLFCLRSKSGILNLTFVRRRGTFLIFVKLLLLEAFLDHGLGLVPVSVLEHDRRAVQALNCAISASFKLKINDFLEFFWSPSGRAYLPAGSGTEI